MRTSFGGKRRLSGTIAGVCILVASSIAAEASCTVYQHRDFKGSKIILNDGDSIQVAGEKCGHTGGGRVRYLPSWNDQISSFRLTDSCTITIYEHARGCGGAGTRRTTSRTYSYVGDWWNDRASYVECSCR